MVIIRSAKSAFDNARRWEALALFRLASILLRRATATRGCYMRPLHEASKTRRSVPAGRRSPVSISRIV